MKTIIGLAVGLVLMAFTASPITAGGNCNKGGFIGANDIVIGMDLNGCLIISGERVVRKQRVVVLEEEPVVVVKKKPKVIHATVTTTVKKRKTVTASGCVPAAMHVTHLFYHDTRDAIACPRNLSVCPDKDCMAWLRGDKLRRCNQYAGRQRMQCRRDNQVNGPARGAILAYKVRGQAYVPANPHGVIAGCVKGVTPPSGSFLVTQ